MDITMDVINRINELETGELSRRGLTILKFEQSGERYVKIENDTSESQKAFAEKMEFIARFFDMPHIITVVVGDKVYLVNYTVR